MAGKTGGKRLRILVVANQKGGVGKTTTAINLGTALAAVGEKVLLIDSDPQGNASTGLGVGRAQRKTTLYDVLMGESVIADAVVKTELPGLDLVPADPDLSGVELELGQQARRSFKLRDALEPLRAAGEYTYVLIDCPPSLNLLTVNAMAASDAVLVPLQREFFALEGLTQLMRTIELVRGSLNPHLEIHNLIDGTQAEYVLVPDAQANLAPVPDGLSDEQVLMCPDIMSTGFKGAENANIKLGDTVVVFAQGPIGLCATAGARLLGATTIIGVDGNDHRLGIARRMGADVTLNPTTCDVVDEVMKLTGGRGADAAIEALGLQATFESALRVLKPGGTLSSLGVYSQDLRIPLDAFAAGLGDHRIVTALCPGGKERMRRLMNVIASGRIDLGPMVTHRYALDDIVAAYDLFSHQRDGVLKVAIRPA